MKGLLYILWGDEGFIIYCGEMKGILYILWRDEGFIIYCGEMKGLLYILWRDEGLLYIRILCSEMSLLYILER